MQSLRPASDCDIGPDLAIAQLLALQVIRRSLRGDALGGAEDSGWRDVGRVLRRAHAEMVRHQRVGLVVAEEGAVLLTRHERRLLRAIGAAQIPDPALVDNLIFVLAPGRAARPYLTDAIGRMAAGLTRHGHRVPVAAVSASAAARLHH